MVKTVMVAFRPHTRAELLAAIGSQALSAAFSPTFKKKFILVRGLPATLVSVRRRKAVLDYGKVRFSAYIEHVILASHPDFDRVRAAVMIDAENERQRLAADRAKQAKARAERGPITRRPSQEPRDSQRSKVYAWENDFLTAPKLTIELSLKDCQQTINRWSEAYGLGPIRATDGRGRRVACWSPSDRTIKLPRWGRTPWVLAHEFAHARVSAEFERDAVAAHGPEFVFRFLEVLEQQLGQDWSVLVDSASKRGIKIE